MKSALHKYQEYKDSGFTWLGNIPKHWEIERLKDISKLIIDGTHYTPDYTDDGVRFLSVNDVTRKPFDLSQSKFISRDAHRELIKRCHPKKGDILLSKNGTIGVPFLIDFEDEVSIYVSLCLIKLLPKINGRYSYYSFLASFMFEQYNLHSKMTSVTNLHLDKLRNFFQLSPPIDEQEAIASYLDTKTAQIDRKIDLLTQKAQRYEELKRSLINETVTRGLDKSVPMKDSSIEWIGEIPEHWEVRRLKDLADIQNSNVDKKTHQGELPIRLCNYVDVYKNDFIDSSLDFMEATATKEEIRKFRIAKGDVFITKDSETCDDIAIAALARESFENVICGYHLAMIRVKKKTFMGDYLFRLFQSDKYGFRFVVSAKGITRVGLGQSSISDALTPIPPLPEQKTIAHYLDTKTAQIDQIIQTINTQIEKLKELRKTLINDVVTGKIKVMDN